jgi:hypothetical protein
MIVQLSSQNLCTENFIMHQLACTEGNQLLRLTQIFIFRSENLCTLPAGRQVCR